MRKKIVAFILTILLISISGMEVCAKETFTSLNPVIEVGEKVYVQHDENNDNVYDLQKSGTGTTTIYEVLLPEFTANKAWTRDGQYIDNVAVQSSGVLTAHGATAPENYIPVKSGEEYFIRAYGVGWTKSATGDVYYYAPVLFLDDNDKVIGDALYNTLSASKAGVMVTVPENATKMHLTMYNNQSFTIQKALHLTDKQFDAMTIDKTALVNTINQTYEEYKKDKILYKNLDKAYITFVNDDTRYGVDIYADIFISKKVPLVLATVPEALIENASSQKETRLEVARRVEAAGGEIIAHNGTPLTQEGFSDYSTMYSFFIRTKQLFNYYDFDVNGIILSGGAGQVTGAEESERWASSIYSYSDLYGVEYDNDDIAYDSVYFHGRGGLGNYQNDLDAIKADIDKTISEKSWRVFYFHDSNEIKEEVLSQVLDYVNSKSESELEVVTYKEMYEKNAAKESEIMNTNTTYYVSSTGTSTSGTSASDPMSYETAQNKTYNSGDTILFKKGDTFYGTFNPTIAKTNDRVTTISSYGEGEMPNIVGYKIADSANSWQMHVEGLYKIYLKGINYFSGLMTIDDNSANVGYMEDKNGVKYYSKKGSLSELSEQYDFYCDGSYLYIKSDENPYNKLGELKLATKTNLLIMKSNMKIENIKFSGTGAHGLVNSDATIDNVEIVNNVIEDIGGSYLKETIRYGNGIEFYGTDASNIVVKNNIIRNVYDVGFTIQGTQGSGTNVVVKNNVFVSNTQDSEIWESGTATGIHSYEFTDNISINQGRGWGYDARPDKYAAAHILFWQYLLEDTNIYFHHNIVYNPRRLYFAEQTNGTNIYFKEKDYIKSDYNTYLCTAETTIFRDSYTIAEKDDFIADYKKDANSTFSLIEVDENIVQTAVTSNEIKTIRKIFKDEEDTGKGSDTENGGKTEDKTSNSEESTEEQSTVLEKGTQFTDTKTNAVYKVITTGTNGTVEYVKNTKKNAKTVTIPATVTVGDATYKVTVVAAKALKGNKKVTKVVVGKNVKTIGNEAFNGCKKLKSLTLGKNVTTIGKKAFYKCTALTKVTIPSKVKKIGAYAFYGCKKLKNITIKSKYLTTKNVGKKAFSGIYKKVKVKVPSSKKKVYKKLLRKRGISSKATIK